MLKKFYKSALKLNCLNNGQRESKWLEAVSGLADTTLQIRNLLDIAERELFLAAQNHYFIVENASEIKPKLWKKLNNLENKKSGFTCKILLCTPEAEYAVKTWTHTQDANYKDNLDRAFKELREWQREADSDPIRKGKLEIKRTVFVPLSLSIVDDSIMVLVPNAYKPAGRSERPAFIIQRGNNPEIFESYSMAYKNRFSKKYCAKITDAAIILDNGELEVLPEKAKNDYQDLKPLGKGSMKEVYQAEDILRKRAVALIRLLPTLAKDDNCRERIKSEYEKIKKMKLHPNVIEVYECYEKKEGNGNYAFWIAEEYLSGGSLRKILKSRVRLKKDNWKDLLIPIAEALCHVHKHGIVHRDIKPDNIMLDKDNRPKLVDFGFALEKDELNRHSATLEIPGTPEYMSPEQLSGVRDLTEATDVYSFGKMALELLVGEADFRIQRTEKNMSYLPNELHNFINSCLQEDPNNRIKNGCFLQSALKAIN